MKRLVTLSSWALFVAIGLFAGLALAQAGGADGGDVIEKGNLPDHEAACEPIQHEPPTEFACEFDTDCVVCHDGSACGRIVNQTTYEEQGASCLLADSHECEDSQPRCCEGSCVRSGF